MLAADHDNAVDLDDFRLEPGGLIFPRHVHDRRSLKPEDAEIRVPLDKDGNFDLADFAGDTLPAGMARRARPFTEERIWHMGIQLAARQLGLDLAAAKVDLSHGRITLRGPQGLERVIPVDADGFFYVDWSLAEEETSLTHQSAMDLLIKQHDRAAGLTNDLPDRWRGKLAVIGSRAVGKDLNDLGATPLHPDTWLVSKHWNVASSVITGQFVHRASLAAELAATLVFGNRRALRAFMLEVLLAAAYVVLAVVLFVRSRYWLPIFLPLVGAGLVNYTFLLVYRVVFEQAERRRIKSIFSNMVSPKIVNELLGKQTLGLGGSRCEITVLFADVRGFTEFTDASQKEVAAYIAEHHLSGAEAEACYERQANETLETVNTYLGLVADTIIRNDGTLDKFIGDCVMAFWGAPTPNPRHALACVRAAIEGQRAIHALNRERAVENERRARENPQRLADGRPSLPPLPILTLGTGINTGLATAGLMGSEQTRQFSYTVFGRDVNLASRLEGASGRGRIFISETTHEHLRHADAALAATCVEQPEALKLKGFSAAVRVFEVPWRTAGDDLVEGEKSVNRPDTTTFVPANPAR